MGRERREKFLNMAVELMSGRPGGEIMILIASPDKGIEAIHTDSSFLWVFGILSAAEKMYDERYRMMTRLGDSQGQLEKFSDMMTKYTNIGGGTKQ